MKEIFLDLIGLTFSNEKVRWNPIKNSYHWVHETSIRIYSIILVYALDRTNGESVSNVNVESRSYFNRILDFTQYTSSESILVLHHTKVQQSKYHFIFKYSVKLLQANCGGSNQFKSVHGAAFEQFIEFTQRQKCAKDKHESKQIVIKFLIPVHKFQVWSQLRIIFSYF